MKIIQTMTRKKKLRVFEAFAGYGSQAMALERLKAHDQSFDFEVVGISEIFDKAVDVYNHIHGETKNYGDISRIEWDKVPDFDLFTYSFPCQDLSTMGKQCGFDEGSGTRSSLLWECKKAIEAKRPKFLMLENVKAILSKKNEANLRKWLGLLESYGYSNYSKVLNALDYGVPQARQRAFVISILEEHKPFEFPKPIPLKKTLSDIMEKNVPQRYWKIRDKNGDYDRKRINEMVADGTIDFSKPQFISLYNWAANDRYAFTLRATETWDFFLTDNGGLRIPTERERFRLMGVDDNTIDKILSHNLGFTKYNAMAGNSIVVDVLFYLFKEMFTLMRW